VNESRLGFEPLPHISIETALGDETVNLSRAVFVPLAQNAALALFHVSRSPRRIEMVERDQTFLDVCASAQLLRAAKKNSHAPGTDFLEKGQLLRVAVVILDKGDLLFRLIRERKRNSSRLA
jgi:hypothetical protein